MRVNLPKMEITLIDVAQSKDKDSKGRNARPSLNPRVRKHERLDNCVREK